MGPVLVHRRVARDERILLLRLLRANAANGGGDSLNVLLQRIEASAVSQLLLPGVQLRAHQRLVSGRPARQAIVAQQVKIRTDRGTIQNVLSCIVGRIKVSQRAISRGRLGRRIADENRQTQYDNGHRRS